jgi:hypothetical protein
VELVIVTLLCEGHILIDDVPGIGKTMLARSVAKSLGCTFRRVRTLVPRVDNPVTVGIRQGRPHSPYGLHAENPAHPAYHGSSYGTRHPDMQSLTV